MSNIDNYSIPKNTFDQIKEPISSSLMDNMITLRKLFSNSSDFTSKNLKIYQNNIYILYCEGMINLQLLDPLIISRLLEFNMSDSSPNDFLNWMENKMLLTTEQKTLLTYEDIFNSIMSGDVVILLDGVPTGISASIPGFKTRSISESTTEVDIRSSREAFIESIKVNQTMIRRRIKSPALKFDMLKVGNKSNTSVSLIYLTDCTNPKLIRQIKSKLSKIDIDIILDSAYLQSFLAENKYGIFPEIGYTERPDTLCGKISEGRVAILVDGSSFAIFLPYLFIENFQKMDDYTNRPFFSSFIRILRYLSFFMSILLPGLYIAISYFHPELFPQALLFNIDSAQELTPFPLIFEALLINIIYELMREAGLRLPRQIGHAVSIVGALVIGESAVSSGIIGAPMIMIVALTAITSFIMSNIYQTICVLKFIFIILGGFFGLYGITLGLCVILVNICSINSFETPFLAPVSPFNLKFMQDVFIRRDWKILSKNKTCMQKMPGVKKYNIKK